MASEKSLILVIQSITAFAAVFRIGYLLLSHMGDEDKTVVKNKCKNVLKALILIMLITSLGETIMNYYGGMP